MQADQATNPGYAPHPLCTPSLIADHTEAPAVSMISGTNLQGDVEPEKKPARLWLGQGFVSAGHNATCRLSHFPGACGDSDCQAHLTLSSTPSLCTCNRPGDHSRRAKKNVLARNPFGVFAYSLSRGLSQRAGGCDHLTAGAHRKWADPCFGDPASVER